MKTSILAVLSGLLLGLGLIQFVDLVVWVLDQI